MGPAQSTHAASAGESRIRHTERQRLLLVLRIRSRNPGTGLLQLRPWRLAHHRAEQQHELYDYPVLSRLRSGDVVAAGPQNEHEVLHTRVLASPAVQLRARAWQQSRGR